MTYKIYISLFFLYLCSLYSTDAQHAVPLPYDVNNPEAVISLPDELEEISGLSLASDGRHLCAIQDENGIIYYIDKESGAITQKKKFWKDGDYEGIEVVGNTVWVSKSTATLYQVTALDTDTPVVEKYKSFLEKDYDVEGLAYDDNKQQLYIACKGKAGEGKNFDKKRAIYAFDLNTKEVYDKPAYIISLNACRTALKENTSEKKCQSIFAKFFDDKKDDIPFAPSAIAIHPTNKQHIYYIF